MVRARATPGKAAWRDRPPTKMSTRAARRVTPEDRAHPIVSRSPTVDRPTSSPWASSTTRPSPRPRCGRRRWPRRARPAARRQGDRAGRRRHDAALRASASRPVRSSCSDSARALGSMPALRSRPGSRSAKRLAGKPRETVAVLLPADGEPDGDRLGPDRGADRGDAGPGPAQDRARPAIRSRLLQIVVPPEADGDAAGAAGPPRRDRRRGDQPGARPGQHPAGREDRRPSWPSGCATVADGAGLEVEVWDLERIRAGAVRRPARASPPARTSRPRVRHARRTARAATRPTLALVGKGVTFDSGGPLAQAVGLDGGHEVRHDRRRGRARDAAGRRPARAAGQCRRLRSP